MKIKLAPEGQVSYYGHMTRKPDNPPLKARRQYYEEESLRRLDLEAARRATNPSRLLRWILAFGLDYLERKPVRKDRLP